MQVLHAPLFLKLVKKCSCLKHLHGITSAPRSLLPEPASLPRPSCTALQPAFLLAPHCSPCSSPLGCPGGHAAAWCLPPQGKRPESEPSPLIPQAGQHPAWPERLCLALTGSKEMPRVTQSILSRRKQVTLDHVEGNILLHLGQ